MSHEKSDLDLPRSKKLKSAPSREVICLDDASASSTNTHPGLAFSVGTSVSNAASSARMPACRNANRRSNVSTTTVNNAGSRRSPVSSDQIVDRGTNPVVGATVFARNSGSSNPRQTLGTITNSILNTLEENVIVGSTISTLNRYKNMIMHAAFSDQKFGLEVTPVARGNVK